MMENCAKIDQLLNMCTIASIKLLVRYYAQFM